MVPAQVRDEAGQSGEQAQVQPHRRRLRTGRGFGVGLVGRVGLRRPLLLLPGQPAPGAQHRRTGWHQRREELPERRRQRVPALLRHGQGRGLPRPRVQCVPARRGFGQHHRPVRGPGRAFRARVQRLSRQSLLRRGAGVAHFLRAGTDGTATSPGRLPSAGPANRRRQGDDVFPHRDAGPRAGRWPGAWHRDPGLGVGQGRVARGGRGHPGHGRLRQRLLPVDQRQGLQRDGDLAGAQAGRRLR